VCTGQQFLRIILVHGGEDDHVVKGLAEHGFEGMACYLTGVLVTSVRGNESNYLVGKVWQNRSFEIPVHRTLELAWFGTVPGACNR
jgi:hypothetical protein